LLIRLLAVSLAKYTLAQTTPEEHPCIHRLPVPLHTMSVPNLPSNKVFLSSEQRACTVAQTTSNLKIFNLVYYEKGEEGYAVALVD
jgi:hypothetical protein